MAVLDKILVLIKLLKLSSIWTYRGVVRTLSFFSSGIYSYLAMFFYVIWINRGRTIEEVVMTLSQHDIWIAEGLITVLGGATGLSYFDAVSQVFNSAIFILWYVRSGAFALKLLGGDNLPPVYRWGLASVAYVGGVFVVAGRFPTALLDLALNFEHVVDWGRLNPFVEGSVNETVFNRTSFNISSGEVFFE